MTDQEIVAGRGDIAQASGTLGLNIYGQSEYPDTLETLFSSSDVGQGSGAVAWLTGDFLGSILGVTPDQIVQLWDNNGTLAVNLYSGGFLNSFDLGQGPGAVAWLTGDFTGSGHKEIAQLWDNKGNLGLNVYQLAGQTPQTVIDSSDLGQGSGAVAWLTGDFTRSGRDEIAQLWDNNGTLALNVYTIAGSTVETLVASNLGQGPGALAWLTGYFTGSDNWEIAQLWDNNGTLALNVYTIAGGTVETLVASDLGQATGAVAWLTGDFTGSERTEFAQLWDNNGTLGAVIYGVINGTVETLFGSSDLDQGSGAVAWLTGYFTGPGNTEIAQLWDEDGLLNVNIYAYSDGSLQYVGGIDPFRVHEGSGALAWLTGDFTGSGLTAIAQPWDN
jgi:hypothetical protein